ncbi:hypothetical protein E4U39_005554 [Claviceps sp. Clav50 group G5]|nr:hypothetical protein E4U39_005554 [Claviceps sp. Clav50 group G5]
MDRFICPFNTERDTLYVSPERWAQFVFEPLKLRHGSQICAPHVNVVQKDIRLAMPDVVFWHTILLRMFPATKKYWFSGLGTVFIILDRQPDSEHDSRYWWEMEDTELGALV